MCEPDAISVVLVEDQNLIRLGIRTGIAADQDITIVAEAHSGEDALAQVMALKPDVVLMDIGLPGINGIEATRLLKAQNQTTKVIMLTSHDSKTAVQAALASGASGYCLKDVEPASLCAAIKAVCRGDVWIDPSIAEKMLQLCLAQKHVMDDVDDANQLTALETKVLQLMLKGATLNAIAEQCNLSQDSTLIQTVSLLNKAGRAGPKDSSSFDYLSDKFENLGRLGQGGMSVVYKARHKIIGKIVAIKFLAAHLCSIEKFQERFMREARITSQLTHNNIISIHDYGISKNNEPFIVMDYVEGPSLSDMLKRVGQIKEKQALKIFKQLAAALAYAHGKGVVHRDVKPSNVILSLEESNLPTLKLLDFGLAKVLDQEHLPQAVTQAGEVFGSPIYMSPEQCRGLPANERSDIYSLGCLMYETLLGHPPFYGPNSMATIQMHVLDEPPPPAPDLCSTEMRNILYRCLRKDPQERFANAEELEKALPEFGPA